MQRAGERYRIMDEPRRGGLSRWAVNPMLPFILFMVFLPAGVAAFMVNALALNGHRKWQEMALAAAALPAQILLTLALAHLVAAAGWPASWVPYLKVIPLALYLWLGYQIYLSQAATHDLKRYFDEAGGRL